MTADFFPRGFLWSPRRGAQDIGDLGGWYHTEPIDLNDRGQVAGRSYITGGGARHAFRWDSRSGAMTDLGTGVHPDGPCDQSLAVAINGRGEVVGNRVDNDGGNFCSGVAWGRHSTAALPFEPAAVNDRGMVVGTSTDTVGDPFNPPSVPPTTRSPRSGRMTDLGRGAAVAVNRSGVVIGTAPSVGDRTHGALWTCADH